MKTELLKKIELIESRLKTVVDQSSGENIAFELNERTNLLSETPVIMELASKIYDEAKWKLAEEMFFDEKKLNAKQQVQMMYIAGKLKEENALYVRAERAIKALDRSIEGLRSLLSYDKAMTKI
ncbi:MAG: hypothetical protein A2Z57_04800 [Planctomycetes bacterium RIFCSPHIGHO2_12_39_6]|nr:MAG: hypothetical protein A2Z57_04800 [Planctomycetes bacterium RIFCSPHIGHO2_12_39_6]